MIINVFFLKVSVILFIVCLLMALSIKIFDVNRKIILIKTLIEFNRVALKQVTPPKKKKKKKKYDNNNNNKKMLIFKSRIKLREQYRFLESAITGYQWTGFSFASQSEIKKKNPKNWRVEFGSELTVKLAVYYWHWLLLSCLNLCRMQLTYTFAESQQEVHVT